MNDTDNTHAFTLLRGVPENQELYINVCIQGFIGKMIRFGVKTFVEISRNM